MRPYATATLRALDLKIVRSYKPAILQPCNFTSRQWLLRVGNFSNLQFFELAIFRAYESATLWFLGLKAEFYWVNNIIQQPRTNATCSERLKKLLLGLCELAIFFELVTLRSLNFMTMRLFEHVINSNFISYSLPHHLYVIIDDQQQLVVKLNHILDDINSVNDPPFHCHSIWKFPSPTKTVQSFCQ